MRAVPRSTCRASLRVDSPVRTTPILGSLTCLRSEPARPNAPVVNRHDNPARFPLNLGNRAFGPRRLRRLESSQCFNAAARLARPEEYASLEFLAHHGATSA